jgi:hypothetical protein
MNPESNMSESVEVNVRQELDRVEAQWPRIETVLADEACITRSSDAVSKWGVGQQLLHLLRVKKMILGGMLQIVANPAAGSPNATSDFKREVLANGIPRGVGDAPPAVRVDVPPALEEIRGEMQGARENWRKVLDGAERIEAARGTFPHHRLGPMNPAEWLCFIAHHNDLHLAIIEDILKTPDTP